MSTVNFNDSTPSAPANFTNLKWQSDASGNISAYDPGGTWQTWTPTFAAYPGDGITVTLGTLYDAQYLRSGAQTFFKLRMGLTFGGTLTSRFIVTGLPLPLVGDVSGFFSECNSGGNYTPGGAYIAVLSSTTSLVITNASNFTTGPTWLFIGNGFYRTT